jgi:hypothetical protein
VWKEVPPTLSAWWKSADSPNYAKAFAHEPNFDDKALWPSLSGKEYYLKSQWPKTRLYVWANPGKNGVGDKNGLNPTEAKNWLLDGKPAAELKLDETADILLPASATPYTVGFRGTGVREVVRHVTVEAGASFRGGGDGAGRQISGNVWIKKGGSMYAQGARGFLGANHTFFRNDNPVEANALNGGVNACSQYFTFGKENASVEFIGVISVLDEFKVYKGATCIVGVDCILHPGRSAGPDIAKGGSLVLLDGAHWGKWTNEFNRAIDLRCAGTLQGGLPERPLTRPATVGLSFRNWQKQDFSKWLSESKNRDGSDVRLVSAIFSPGAEIRSVTTDPAKALLTITWTGIEKTNVVGDPRASDKKSLGHFSDEEFAKQFNSIPRKITLAIDNGVAVDGLILDNVHPGGLLVRDAAERAKWKNVQFGPNNSGKPDELFKPLPGFLDKSGNY